MATPLYSTAEIAWSRILERGWGVSVDEPYALEILELSAGTDSDSDVHYRAFFVGAKLLEQNLTTQRITEADGAKFTRQQPVIDSLLNSQRQYDESKGLTIPDGFEAIPSDCDRCDTSGSGGVIDGFVRRPATVKVTVT